MGDVAPVGEGVSELRIHYGPGYRVYFVRRGSVYLLCGGDKSTQAVDIKRAKQIAKDWKGMSPMAEKFSKYDAAEFLRTPEEIRQFLEIVFEENPDDHVVIANAIGAATRAHGMMKTARETGLTREGLYKSFSENGNPSFAAVLKVMKALGLGLKPVTIKKSARPRVAAE